MTFAFICSHSLIAGGLALAALGLLGGYVIIPNLIDNTIESELVLKPGNEDTWKDFLVPPVAPYIEFTFLNFTNADEYPSDVAKKPRVNEYGPCVLRQDRGRYADKEVDSDPDAVVDPNKLLVSFYNRKTYYFEEEMSDCDLDTEITLVNIPLVAIASVIGNGLNWGTGWPALANALQFLGGEEAQNFTATHTIREWLFDGYESQIIQAAASIAGDILPPEYADGIFGLYRQNFTDEMQPDDGWFTLFNGKGDISNLGNMIAWNEETELSHWDGEYCNMLNGTDGSVFRPFLGKDSRLYIYSTDLCRSIYADYVEEITHRDIDGYRYEVMDYVLYGYEKNPDNRCFCPHEEDDKCLGDGLLDIRSCSSGIPIVISLPHFLNAEEDTKVNMVDGLSPDPSLHTTYFEVEPRSGVPLRLAKKIQLNILMRDTIPNLEAFEEYNNLGRGYDLIMPLLWVNEFVELDEKNADRWKESVGAGLKAAEGIKWGGFSLGLVLAIGGAAWLVIQRRRARTV